MSGADIRQLQIADFRDDLREHGIVALQRAFLDALPPFQFKNIPGVFFKRLAVIQRKAFLDLFLEKSGLPPCFPLGFGLAPCFGRGIGLVMLQELTRRIAPHGNGDPVGCAALSGALLNARHSSASFPVFFLARG